MFSIVEESMVDMIDYFEICHGTRILPSYFAIEGYELLPLLKPSFGDKVDWHSLHDGGVVVVFSEKLGELGFLVVDNLF